MHLPASRLKLAMMGDAGYERSTSGIASGKSRRHFCNACRCLWIVTLSVRLRTWCSSFNLQYFTWKPLDVYLRHF